MTDVNLAYSRPEATAARLEKFGADVHRFPEKSVCLTGEIETLKTKNGRVCFLSSARLLVRTFRKVSIWIPPGVENLRDECRALIKSIEFGEPVTLLTEGPPWQEYSAILNVGHTNQVGLPWTSINSHGWLARVTSTATPISAVCEVANPIAALFAACMGVAELFKRVLPVPEARFPPADGTSFNLYHRHMSDDPGPSLPKSIALNWAWIVGLGAIGNGVAYLVKELEAKGHIVCVDKQKYGPENLGTCAVLTPAGVKMEKAEYISKFLQEGGNIKCHPQPHPIDELRQKIGTEIPHPSIVLSGLDAIEARHETQDVWPDVLIDGAIGDFMVQVATHTWPSEHACMKCLFPKPVTADHNEIGAKHAGLPVQLTRDPEAVITDADIESAPEEKRQFLRDNRGKKVCSVVSAAAIKALSDSADDFSPSVPFVACASAALMITAAIQWLSGDAEQMPKRFFFDILQGPSAGDEIAERAKNSCQCQQRKKTIDAWRTQVSEFKQA
jgi:hypothetical protein